MLLLVKHSVNVVRLKMTFFLVLMGKRYESVGSFICKQFTVVSGKGKDRKEERQVTGERDKDEPDSVDCAVEKCLTSLPSWL